MPGRSRHAAPAGPSRHVGLPAMLPRGFRPDIEGLRAIAVTLVVLYHAGLLAASGGYIGVDVFFVLSGFLITGLLVDELNRSGRIAFADFYGRRIRRLLPASTFVLVVTTLVFAATLSPLDRPALGADVRSAALYVANWHFAAQAVDYLAGGHTSPVLHYWSLGVEEQFYLCWPLLLVLVAGSAARRGRLGDVRRLTAFTLTLVAAVSLTLSAEITSRSEPYAYYGLHTRAWELACGGLLALAPAGLARVPRAPRMVAGWVGLGLVVGTAFGFDETTAFPGLSAALPVLGTMLLVAAGAGGQRAGVPLLLALRPLRYVGRVSYSWYLWHWPVLVLFALHVHGVSPDDSDAAAPGLGAGVALLAIVLSFGLAAATHHLVEDPVRRSRALAAVRARSLSLGAAATATAVLVPLVAIAVSGTGDASGTTVVTAAATEAAGPAGSATGAASRSARVVHRQVRLRMTPSFARQDRPHGDERCYAGYDSARAPAPASCLFGDPRGSRTLVLLGDSHAQQWFRALDTQARKRHWKLYVWVKSECPFTDIDLWLPQFHGRYPTCRPWRDSVLRHLASIGHADAVLLGHTSTYRYHLLLPGGRRAHTAAEIVAGWSAGFRRMQMELTHVAARVLVLRDPPRPTVDVPACLTRHPHDATRCAVRRTVAFTWSDRLLRAEEAAGLAPSDVLDLVPQMCPGDVCQVVSGSGLIMYRDDNHLTTSYTMTLAARLGDEVAARLR